MMHLRSLVEKAPDANILWDMISLDRLEPTPKNRDGGAKLHHATGHDRSAHLSVERCGISAGSDDADMLQKRRVKECVRVAGARRKILSAAGAVAAKFAESPAAQTLLFNAIRLNRPEFFRLWSQSEIRFLNYAFAMRARSRSQILQDLWVCFELDEMKNGFFVEFGATDGVTNSNTWLLENALGWKGILAEPNPFWHSQLAANRRAAVERKCVSSTSGKTVSFTTTDESNPELGGIIEFSEGDHFAGLRKNGKIIEVETISLIDLLHKYQAPKHIDYLSIDTEGSELDILSAFDFKKYDFSLISVEQNQHTELKIQKLLEINGYVRVFNQFSQWDGWYVSAKLGDRKNPKIHAPLV